MVGVLLEVFGVKVKQWKSNTFFFNSFIQEKTVHTYDKTFEAPEPNEHYTRAFHLHKILHALRKNNIKI